MNSIWSPQIDSILSGGRALDDAGIKNWGLPRDQALTAIDRIAQLRVPILGGDVHVVGDDSRVASTYDNWYCDRRPGESEDAFMDRSVASARAFVQSYGPPSGLKGTVLFAIVPGV